MPRGFLDWLSSVVQGLGLSLSLTLGLIILPYLAVTLILWILVSRGVLPRKGVNFVNWIFLLLALLLADQLVLSKLDNEWVDKAVLAVSLLIAWRLFKSFIEGFYAEIYLRMLKKRQVNSLTVDFIKFSGLIVLIMLGLKSIFGVQLGSLLTSSAILTAVIGFSMQDTIGSLVSGLFIQIEKPFTHGDWVKLSDIEGQVVEISGRYIKLQTQDENVVLIPNNQISRSILTNFSRPSQVLRQIVKVPGLLDLPPVRMKAALEQAMRSTPLVLDNPAPRVQISEINENKIVYDAIFYVDGYPKAKPARDQVQASLWYVFKSLNLDFPRPLRLMARVKDLSPEDSAGHVQAVGKIGLFNGMPEKDIELLIDSSLFRTYGLGQRIVAQSESGTTLFVILKGRVAVCRDGSCLAELEQGQFFGEMALLTGEPRQADVDALTDTMCLEIDREAFRIILRNNPRVMRNVEAMFEARTVKSQGENDPGTAAEAGKSLFERFRKIFFND